MEDRIAAVIDFAALYQPRNGARIRPQFTGVKFAHDRTPATAETSSITHADAGELKSVRVCNVLAFWHRVVPYPKDQLAQTQTDALNDQQTAPLIYTNVLLRNWKALDGLKIDSARTCGNIWVGLKIDFSVSMGDYRIADTPSDPVIVHFFKVMAEPGFPSCEQALEVGGH